ncbi:MAG: hypothetical protein RIG62_26905 [Cyclobacteriaceae bacterium]
MKYFIAIAAFLVAALQIKNLFSKFPQLINWIVFILSFLVCAATCYQIYKDDFEKKYEAHTGKIDGRVSSSIQFPTIGVGCPGSKITPTVPGKFQYFTSVPFAAKIKDGKLLIDIDLYGMYGTLIAQMRSNEWQLNRNNYFDKNFDDKGLEVTDNRGTVVLQLYIVNDVAVISGLFYDPDGYATFIQCHDSVGEIDWFDEPGLYPSKERYYVKPIFKHPSALHPGERIHERRTSN